MDVGETAVPSGEAHGDRQAAPRRELRAAPRFDLEIDPSLDLDPKIQEELLEFAAGLGRPYHEILGVALDADDRTIKKAYFQKSKRFHPDRYFRKNLGEYERVVDTCFKKLLEAYELLSDPATREEVQKRLRSAGKAAASPSPAGTPPAQEGASEGTTAPPAEEAVAPSKPRLSGAHAARRLRRKMSGLHGHKKIKTERKQRAKSFFESGMTAFLSERWLEAAGSVRLAIAFDPENEAYREEFAKVQRRAHEERAKILMKQGENAMDLRDHAAAFEAFEEAVHYRPFDADLAIRAARLAWQVVGDLHKAKDLAVNACELEPERGDYRRLLGQIYKAAGLDANAKRELEAAVRIDSKDKEAKAELRGL